MNVFYAHVPPRTEVMPRSAVVLGESHLRTKDLGRGQCPDCPAETRPQMFGTQRGGGVCVLGLVLSVWTAALSHSDPQRLLENGGGALQLCHWPAILPIHQS